MILHKTTCNMGSTPGTESYTSKMGCTLLWKTLRARPWPEWGLITTSITGCGQHLTGLCTITTCSFTGGLPFNCCWCCFGGDGRAFTWQPCSPNAVAHRKASSLFDVLNCKSVRHLRDEAPGIHRGFTSAYEWIVKFWLPTEYVTWTIMLLLL